MPSVVVQAQITPPLSWPFSEDSPVVVVPRISRPELLALSVQRGFWPRVPQPAAGLCFLRVEVPEVFLVGTRRLAACFFPDI